MIEKKIVWNKNAKYCKREEKGKKKTTQEKPHLHTLEDVPGLASTIGNLFAKTGRMHTTHTHTQTHMRTHTHTRTPFTKANNCKYQ